MPRSWVVVVPVKGNPGAKGRLAELPGRAALADAFALDTVTALLAASVVERVFVVTADARLASALAALGAVVVPEVQPPPRDSLNAAIMQGANAARQAFPDLNLAIVTGDLPALASREVEAALALASSRDRSMMPDADGTGTTALFALAGVSVTPRFGLGSRAAHEAAGHVPLEFAQNASIRRDVDTPADLAAAQLLGVGRHTGELLGAGSGGLPPAAPEGPRRGFGGNSRAV